MYTSKLLCGPVAISGTGANIYQIAGGSVVIFDLIEHIHIVNMTLLTSVTLWLGPSFTTVGAMAGFEIIKLLSIPAYGTWDYYGELRASNSDINMYLSGFGGLLEGDMNITVEGRQGVIDVQA